MLIILFFSNSGLNILVFYCSGSVDQVCREVMVFMVFFSMVLLYRLIFVVCVMWVSVSMLFGFLVLVIFSV